METKTTHVDMHVDDLATFMFLKNKNNAIVELSLGGIENNKDLFFFCLDLLCKGLVLLYGENGRVDVEILTLDSFKLIEKKMALAGIHVKLHIESIAIDPTEECVNAINLDDINLQSDNELLTDYVFKMKMDSIIYNIAFELVHHGGSRCSRR